MKTPKKPKVEKQMNTEADDFAQEVNYAVTHGGRELHPEQQQKQRTGKAEKQMDSEADDFAQEVNYAATHGGRELHPEQQAPKKRAGKKAQSAHEPWQID